MGFPSRSWPADPAFKEPSGFAVSAAAISIEAIAPHILGNRTCDGGLIQNRMPWKNGAPPLSHSLVHVALKTPIAEESQPIAMKD